MSETDIENPGAPFRVTREKLGLSIQDVSIATKINPRILRALEDGDKRSLPPISFARGFIRSYAAYLKIDSKPILNAYNLNIHNSSPHIQAEVEEQKARSDGMATAEKRSEGDSERRTEKPERRLYSGVSQVNSKLYIVGGLIALVLLVFGIKRIFDKYAQEREVPVVTIDSIQKLPEEDTTQLTDPIEAKSIDSNNSENEIEQKSQLSALPSVIQGLPQNQNEKNEVQDSKPSTNTSDTKVKDASVTTSAAVTTTPPQVKEPVNEAEKSAQPQATPEAPKPVATVANVAPPVSKAQEIIIEALDKVDINIAIDGGDFKKITLAPESLHTIKASSSVRLEIKDGGMVNIIHNGRDKGVPGDLGKPISLKYP